MSHAQAEDLEELAARTIAEHRRNRGLSLTAVATASGVSPAHLSRIERGERVPSLGVLLQLTQAYNVTLGELVGEHQPGSLTVRHSVVRPHPPAAGVAYRPLLTHADPGIVQIVLVDIAVGTETPPSSHPGTECIFMLEGTVELSIGTKRWTLSAGDTIDFDSADEHVLRSVSGAARAMLVIISPVATADAPTDR